MTLNFNMMHDIASRSLSSLKAWEWGDEINGKYGLNVPSQLASEKLTISLQPNVPDGDGIDYKIYPFEGGFG